VLPGIQHAKQRAAESDYDYSSLITIVPVQKKEVLVPPLSSLELLALLAAILLKFTIDISFDEVCLCLK